LAQVGSKVASGAPFPAAPPAPPAAMAEEEEGQGGSGEAEAPADGGDDALDAEASIEGNTAAMLSDFQESAEEASAGQELPSAGQEEPSGGDEAPSGEATGASGQEDASGGLDAGGTVDFDAFCADDTVASGGGPSGGEASGGGPSGEMDDNGETVTDAFEAAVESNTAAMLAEFQEPQSSQPADPSSAPEEGWECVAPDSTEAAVDSNTAAMLAEFGGNEPEAGGAGEADAEDGAEAADEVPDFAAASGNALKVTSGSDSKSPSKEAPGGADSKGDKLIKVKGLDKQQLCIDLLMVGCVQSFVDFFYITQRKSAPSDGTPRQGESKDIDFPEETLIFLKETLESAESARRGGNYQMCFESYNNLAEYFEKVPDLKGAMYFYQRCADIAAEVDARESISKAFLNLGSCEERGKNWQRAMEFHEKALQIATSADSLPLQIKAASRLTEVYQVLAEECEKEGRDSEASMLYERCRACAQLSKDANLEGTACHKLGLSKFKTGAHDQAVELQKQYLDICRMHDDRIGESKARGALAQAYEAMGLTQEAIKQLENLLNVANEAGELTAQANACLNLGILYNGRGEHEKSVELLEQHFDLARQIGDRRLIDSARVVLGMVRGNGKLKSYIQLVNHDLEKLLRWKSKRAVMDS